MTIPDAPSPRTEDPVTAAQALLPLDGGDIHVCQDGPRDAPALLLVHGSGASSLSWQAMVPPLAATHRVVRIDLLGHGRSAQPADGGYGIPEQADRAARVLELLEAAPAVVVGHSSGGYTAVALAERHPQLVRGLALVNTGPRIDALTAQDAGAVSAEVRWPPTDEQIRAFSGGSFPEGSDAPRILAEELRQMSFRSFLTTMRASYGYLAEQPVPERLAALGTPAQAVYGELDGRWVPAAYGDYRAVPGIRVDPLPGVGHTSILEAPERVAALVLAFAAGLGDR
ncbi:alpha/beta fold hydrolase [Streptomyces sp. NPDC021224]|uniref:alpha/beta fold hydrolase n=1 Tax=unclassified Streptomyces TaxID=2593676 RepID=UPI0037BD813B